MVKFDIETRAKEQGVNITDEIRQAVRSASIKDGVITIFVPHTSCGVVITENCDPAVPEDILRQLRLLAPAKQAHYKHDGGNSDAHIKAALTGASVQVIVKGGTLQLGTWQGIFLLEFDGPRIRSIWLH